MFDQCIDLKHIEIIHKKLKEIKLETLSWKTDIIFSKIPNIVSDKLTLS